MYSVKKEIRDSVLRKRDELPAAVRGRKNESIGQKLCSLSEYLSAGTILFYASFRSEVETHPIIDQALREKKRIILPKVEREKRSLLLYQINELSDLMPGYMEIPEPRSDLTSVNVNDIDLVIVPGAAFDQQGNRLGYGAGYYDALLTRRSRKIPAVALAFEEQIMQQVPAEEHDVKMDIIVTDERVIRIENE